MSGTKKNMMSITSKLSYKVEFKINIKKKSILNTFHDSLWNITFSFMYEMVIP